LCKSKSTTDVSSGGSNIKSKSTTDVSSGVANIKSKSATDVSSGGTNIKSKSTTDVSSGGSNIKSKSATDVSSGGTNIKSKSATDVSSGGTNIKSKSTTDVSSSVALTKTQAQFRDELDMDLGSDDVHDTSPGDEPTTDERSSVDYYEIYTYDTEYPEAFSRAQGVPPKVAEMVEIHSGEPSSARMRSTNSDPDGDSFIIDTGATTSCVKSLHLLRHDSFKRFASDEQVRILGISGDNDLVAPGNGQLHDAFDQTRALYVPDATANILSWWSIRKTHRIQVMRQDEADEHLELINKLTGESTRCYIDPKLGLYVWRPVRTHVVANIYSISHIRQLQKLGLHKRAVVRAARCQDLHESLDFCHPAALRELIVKRGDKTMTRADFDFWQTHYHPNYCRGCPCRGNAPPQADATTRPRSTVGELLHADLFHVTSNIPSGNFTAVAFIDEACGHKSVGVLASKSAKDILQAFAPVHAAYKAAGKPITELRTDGEPTLQALTAPLDATYSVRHTMSEEYRHATTAERGIQTLEKKFLACIHGADVPIPTFLYPELLRHVAALDNAVFNIKNEGLTPREQLLPDNTYVTTDLDDLMDLKFGSLRRYYDPRAKEGASSKKTDERTCSYGVVIGTDPMRPHCHVLWNFVDRKKHSVAHSIKVLWSPALESTYLAACEGHLTSTLPQFADSLAAEIANEPPPATIASATVDMEVENPVAKMVEMTIHTRIDRSHSSETARRMAAMNREVSPATTSVAHISDLFPLPSPPTATRPEQTRHNTNFADQRRMAKYNAGMKEAERQGREHAQELVWAKIFADGNESTEEDALTQALATILPAIDDQSADRLVQSIRRSSRLSRGNSERILNMTIAAASKVHPIPKVTAAVGKELGQMDPHDVWDYKTPNQVKEDRRAGLIKNIIPSSLFLKLKSDMETLKARLIVHGDRQILSEMFGSNSSPTININILLALLSLAAKEKHDFESVDITGAYLNAPLPEPEYMRLPADLAKILVDLDNTRAQYVDPDDGTIVVMLKKALYGLKNSGKLWYQEVHTFMVSMGFVRSEIDKCLFTRKIGDLVTHALVYVDDILLIGNDAVFRTQCKQALVTKFKKITEQPTNSLTFLGMRIKKARNGDITVDQVNMISDLLDEFKISASSVTPCASNILNQHSASLCPPELAKKYRSLNMRLLYLATRTRPDILFPTVVYATRSQQPTTVDYDRLTKIMEYLHCTVNKCLTFKCDCPLSVNAYVDSSFNTHWDSKGHTGFAVFPDFEGSAAIIVKSTKHHSTADSSTEAELMALHEAMKYITWIADVYAELGYDVRPVETFQDNKSCITLSSEESINFRGRSKFINRKYFGIYQHLQDGDAILTHIGTDHMLADVLTKALVGEKFRHFTIALMGKPSSLPDS